MERINNERILQSRIGVSLILVPSTLIAIIHSALRLGLNICCCIPAIWYVVRAPAVYEIGALPSSSSVSIAQTSDLRAADHEFCGDLIANW